MESNLQGVSTAGSLAKNVGELDSEGLDLQSNGERTSEDVTRCAGGLQWTAGFAAAANRARHSLASERISEKSALVRIDASIGSESMAG
jgi:hypothetical protein